jgi:hypothetical protein
MAVAQPVSKSPPAPFIPERGLLRGGQGGGSDGGCAKFKRRPLDEAKQLLAEAGYPDGRDAKTGQPLTLYFDTMASGPEAKSRMDWFRKQFARLDIQLVIRATDYNRFQDKMSKGSAQIFEWGWNADYPDPENFLFLLYGPNRKVGVGGENAANYQNPAFDRLFERMKDMDNGPARQAVIDEMVTIARQDAPWIYAFHPQELRPAPRLGEERQAQPDGPQPAQVPARGPGGAGRLPGGMEPAGAVARRGHPGAAGGPGLAGGGGLPRAAEGDGPCLITSSAACSMPSPSCWG